MPTRQIGWNVGELAIAAMYVLVAVQAFFLVYGATRRYLDWRRGRPYGRITEVGQRLRKALAVAFLHQRLIRPGYVYAGLMHLFIFWGFVVLFIGTVIVLIEADIARPYFGLSFFRGAFYVAYKLIINLLGLLFVVGLLMAVWRRYGQHLPKFRRSLTDDAIVLGLLLALGLSGFLLQGLRLAATRDPAAPIHWVSYPLSAVRPTYSCGPRSRRRRWRRSTTSRNRSTSASPGSRTSAGSSCSTRTPACAVAAASTSVPRSIRASR